MQNKTPPAQLCERLTNNSFGNFIKTVSHYNGKLLPGPKFILPLKQIVLKVDALPTNHCHILRSRYHRDVARHR